MSINAEACAGLIWDICDVALGSRRLEQALGDFARLGGAERAALISIAPNGAKAIAAVSDLDASAIDSYNREFHRLDAILPAEGSEPIVFIPGTTAGEALCPGYERGDFFNAWARPNGAHQIAFMTDAASSSGRSSVLLISPPGDGRFGGRDQLEVLRRVAPHFLRMARLTDRLAPVEPENARLLTVIERFPMGVVMLDGQGRVAHATRRARAALGQGDGLDLGARGLRARQPAAQRQIEAMIVSALRQRLGEPAAPAPPVFVPRPSGRPPYVLQAMSLPPIERDRAPCASLDVEIFAALVTLIDPSRGPRPRLEVVRSAFGLTPAEAVVALRVFDGGGLSQAAAEIGVGVSTVRTHLLRVFQKTGTHRQSDLVRLLASLDSGPCSPSPGI